MRNQWIRLAGLLMLAILSASAEAATCTSIATGSWATAATWSCVGTPVVTIPGATDTAIIASPNTVTLVGSIPVANLTVNVGGALADAGRTLTISGNLINNGTISGGGNLGVTGATAIISGSGTYTDSRLYITGTATTIAAGSVLNFTGSSRLYAGRTTGGATVAASVLTINGTINSTVTTATTNFLRLYATNTVIGSSGAINAGVSAVTYNASTATLTNNGSVNVNKITQNAATNAWTQGVNSSLTVSAVSNVGALDASANGNTVTYNGTSTVIAPGAAGYWNLAGTIFPAACPVAYTISGSNPCPAGGPVSLTMSPGSCVNTAGIGTVAWAPTPTTNVNANDALYATATVNGTTNYLKCTGYNFAIPANAVIMGVTVNVVRKSSSTSRTTDGAMRLLNAGVIGTVDRSTATLYTTADVSEAHGGAADLWGVAWTPADINNANFGAAFAAKTTRSRTVSVNHMPITVTYSAPVMDHVSISAPITAMALTEVAVTITPHTATHGTLAAAGMISLSSSSGTGDWTIGTGTGTLTPGAGNSGLATYTFGTGETSATLGFVKQTAGTVTLNVADSLGADMLLTTPVAEKANTITFSSAGFVFTSSACTHNVAFGTAGQCAKVVWLPRTAGQALAGIYITVVNPSGVPTRLSSKNPTPLDMQFGLSCHDPVANAGVKATFSAVATALPLCQPNGAKPTTWSAVGTLSFPTGSPSTAVSYSFNYADVGKVELWMQDAAPVTGAGSSGAFVLKPAGFVLTNIKRSSDNVANPGAADASGAAFVKAGEAFSATVTAINALSVATPNYGKEVSPESVKLVPALLAGLGLTNNPAIRNIRKGSVTAGSAALTVPDSAAFAVGDRILVVGAGAAGAILGTTVAAVPNATTITLASAASTTVAGAPVQHGFAGGVLTESDFAWDEVGIITLTPQVADASYLAAGDVIGTASGNVGRFSLGKFALQTVNFDERADICQGGVLVVDGVTPCAPVFTYMGEEIDANLTLVPKSLNGVAVRNYVDSATVANDFAKLDPTTFANLNLAAVDHTTAGGPHYLTARISNTALPVVSCATALCFQSGSADVTVPFTFSRKTQPPACANAAADLTCPDGAYTAVEIGIAPVETDGALVEGAGAAPGMCNNPNAADCYDLDSDATAGNDRALLGVTEFRYGRTHISNAYGSELLRLVLPIAAEYWNGTAYVRSLNDMETVIAIALGGYHGNLTAGMTTPTVSAISGGVGRISLTAPGANNNGSVDVSASAPAYLPGNVGRATFGVYKGPFIYMREAY